MENKYLEVPEVAPVMMYAQSLDRLSKKELKELEGIVDKELNQKGIMRIKTIQGMLEARKKMDYCLF